MIPTAAISGTVDNDGARIWYAAFGDGPPVILLHGGLGNAGNWGHQVPALVAAGYRAIVIDSRGQGRSTRDAKPYSYELMAADTRAVMDELGIAKAAFVGWSDGADIALILADETPDRSAGVFFFGCNVDATGTLPFVFTDIIGRVYNHHVRDYAALSPLARRLRGDARRPRRHAEGAAELQRRRARRKSPCRCGRSSASMTSSSSASMPNTSPARSPARPSPCSRRSAISRRCSGRRLFNRTILDFLADIGW